MSKNQWNNANWDADQQVGMIGCSGDDVDKVHDNAQATEDAAHNVKELIENFLPI